MYRFDNLLSTSLLWVHARFTTKSTGTVFDAGMNDELGGVRKETILAELT